MVSFDSDRGFKNRSKPVEVGLTDRVVFMVVALSTANLQPQQNAANRAGQFIQHVVEPLLLRVDVRHIRAGKAKGGGNLGLRVAWE